MSDAEKKRRRARIDRVAKSKPTKLPAVARQCVTYWLARNSVDGQLDAGVSVFLARPTRRRDAQGRVSWTAAPGYRQLADGPAPVHYGTWTPEVCARTCGTYPATDLECIRVG